MINKIRTFIAITFPPEIIKEIARIQSLLEKQNFTGKLIEPENLHLTLKFLGEIPEEKISQVQKELSRIKFSELNLKLSKSGTFNYKGKPKIAWIKVTGNIFELHKKIDSSLSNLFQPETRFMSHLTIARIKHVKNIEAFRQYVTNLKPKPIQFSTDNFKLISSELKSSGPIYTTLQEYKSN